MTVLILLWIIAGIVAILLFIAPLGIWYGISCLREDARRTNKLLEELIDALTTEENTDTSAVSDPLAKAPERPGRSIYEIKHPQQ